MAAPVRRSMLFAIAAVSALLALPASVSASSAERPFAPRPVTRIDRVVLVGDSLAVEATPYLRFLTTGKRFTSRTFGGTAPCDWARGPLGARRSSVVVVSFTGNALTPCMRDHDGEPLTGEAKLQAYRDAVTTIVRRARAAGSWVVLVGQPARPADAPDASDIDAINDLYRELAAARYVAFVDAGAGVETPDGHYAGHLECLPFESTCGEDGRNQVRGDGVHFCPVWGASDACPTYSSGALRFALGIVAAVERPTAFEEPAAAH